MSLTDSIHPNDEKESIEAEYMLAAERDALAHMREFVIDMSSKGARQWRASLVDCESKSIVGTFTGSREECVSFVFDLWDKERMRIAEEIYCKHYK